MSKSIKLNEKNLKKYIKETYKKLGEINYSNYWNLGYINALMDNGLLGKVKAGMLINHNDKIYLIEEMKVINRRKIICEDDEGLHPIVYECE